MKPALGNHQWPAAVQIKSRVMNVRGVAMQSGIDGNKCCNALGNYGIYDYSCDRASMSAKAPGQCEGK